MASGAGDILDAIAFSNYSLDFLEILFFPQPLGFLDLLREGLHLRIYFLGRPRVELPLEDGIEARWAVPPSLCEGCFAVRRAFTAACVAVSHSGTWTSPSG